MSSSQSSSQKNSSSPSDDTKGSSFDAARYWSSMDKVVKGQPTTYGGAVKDAKAQTKTFQSRTVPDIPRKSRIIGVCGIVDDKKDPAQDEGNASPARDGWFFSDFFLFQQLFRGTPFPQTWMSGQGTSPQELLDKYGKKYAPGYLFGAAEGPEPRKVVLSNTMSVLPPVKIVPAVRVLENFLELIKTESAKAVEEDSTLLVFVFGHGNAYDSGVSLGSKAGPPQLTRLTIDKFRAALHPQTRVTLVMTSCYAGGWAISTDLNATVIAGSGPEASTESWGASDTLKRCCGSVFATAVQQVLCDGPPETRLGKENVPLALLEDMDEPGLATYSDFARQIYVATFMTDAFAYRHDIRFSAQDDDWEAQYGRRTGIPLSQYKSRFDALESYANPPQHPSGGWGDISAPQFMDGVDPEPATTPMRLFVRSLRSKTGGYESGAKGLVMQLAKEYITGYTGRDTEAPNVGTHNMIRSLIKGEIKDLEQYESMLHVIEYRTSLRSTANALLESANIKKPLGLSCAEWKQDKFESMAHERKGSEEKFHVTLRSLINAELLQEPLPEQGHDWRIMVYRYIAAAMVVGDQTKDQVAESIRMMQKSRDKAVREVAVALSTDRNVKRSAKRFFDSIGKTLRKLSPVKRWSSGSVGRDLVEDFERLDTRDEE